jgi:hypothetical protein
MNRSHHRNQPLSVYVPWRAAYGARDGVYAAGLAGVSHPFTSNMWFRAEIQPLHVLRLKHVVQNRLDALHEGDAFHTRVEAALGVEKSNGPNRAPLVADAGRLLDTDGSHTFAGDFVRYAVFVSRPSRADPITTNPVPRYLFRQHSGAL